MADEYRSLLTSSMAFTSICVKGPEQENLVRLVIFKVVPLVFLVPEDIVRFSNFMHVNVVRSHKIPFRFHGRVVQQGKWPVLQWPKQWPPDTVFVSVRSSWGNGREQNLIIAHLLFVTSKYPRERRVSQISALAESGVISAVYVKQAFSRKVETQLTNMHSLHWLWNLGVSPSW